jgi:hypothetical protein
MTNVMMNRPETNTAANPAIDSASVSLCFSSPVLLLWFTNLLFPEE